MSLVNNETNYSKVSINGPRYKHTKVLPSSGGGSLTFTATANQPLLFELPSSQSINFAESYLSFDFALPSTANGSFVFTDIPPIARVALKSKTGSVLCEISNFQLYWKLCVLSGIPLPEYVSRSVPGCATAIAASRLQGSCEFANPGNQLPATATAANIYNCTCIRETGAIEQGKLQLPAYRAVMHYASSAIGGAGTMTLQCKLNFSDMINSIFCMNKDIHLPESLLMEVEIIAQDKFAGDHTAVATLAGAATAGVAGTLTNIAIYLGVQQNPELVEAVRSQTVSEGLSFLIPYVSMSSLPLGIATSGNAVVKIHRGYGQRLLRIYSAEYVSANNLNLTANFFNDGTTTTSYSTVLDGNKLQYGDMVITSGDDYKEMNRLLKNTAMCNLQQWYTHCPAWIDEFSGLDDLPEAKNRDFNGIAGLPLDREYNWARQIVSKTAVDTSTAVCVVGQKSVRVSPLGVEVN